MNIFERASRAKLRFATSKGFCSTEDLWDLSLTSLDSIAKVVNKKLKEESEESFITEKSEKNTELELALDILKHVIQAKLDEKERGRKAAETKAKIEQINKLILEKKDAELSNKSVDELQNMLNQLQS